MTLTERIARYREWHLALLERWEKEVTAGPWWNEDGHPAVFAKTPKCRPNGEGLLQVNYYGRYVGKDAYADAAFIASARAGWPADIRAKLALLNALEEIYNETLASVEHLRGCMLIPGDIEIPNTTAGNALTAELDRWEKENL